MRTLQRKHMSELNDADMKKKTMNMWLPSSSHNKTKLPLVIYHYWCTYELKLLQKPHPPQSRNWLN